MNNRDMLERPEWRVPFVADREAAKLGVRRAIEALDWLGDQTGGMLETRVSVLEEDADPMLYLSGHWWVDGVEHRLSGEYVCFASTSKARLHWLARQMLDDYRRTTGTAAPTEEHQR